MLCDCSNTLFKVFSFCRRLDKSDHPLPVNLSRLIINAQKRFSIDRNQVWECWFCHEYNRMYGLFL